MCRRSHHRAELTIAGHAFLERAPLVFERQGRPARDRGHQLVQDGDNPDGAGSLCPADPEVKWQLHELTRSAQIKALVERRIDLGPCRMATEREGPQRQIGDVIIALPRRRPLATRKPLTLAELRERPLVIFGLHQSRFASYVNQCCIQPGFAPQPHSTWSRRSRRSAWSASVGEWRCCRPTCRDWPARMRCSDEGAGLRHLAPGRSVTDAATPDRDHPRTGRRRGLVRRPSATSGFGTADRSRRNFPAPTRRHGPPPAAASRCR